MAAIDTAERRELIGDERRRFQNPDGSPMYEREGGQLRRVGATEACIYCGMPDLPGVLAYAHIHGDDLDLAPLQDPRRVFRLCWHHHHGCYDQNYVSTLELLQAEKRWIENKNRPRPHERDVEIMRSVVAKEVHRKCYWTEGRKPEAVSLFEPERAIPEPLPPNPMGTARALKARATINARQAGQATGAKRDHLISEMERYLEEVRKLLRVIRANRRKRAHATEVTRAL